MCATCGCSGTHDHGHEHPPGHEHAHAHAHADTEHEHVLADGRVLRHAHAGVVRQAAPEPRLVRVERDLLERNDALAAENRRALAGQKVLALNLMSSPGAGKTSLLVRTLEHLRGAAPLAVIEGDQETSLDAQRIRDAGAPAVQVNTGAACHLDAAMVARAMGRLPPLTGGVLFIENVGNLVCPASFDLGESLRVVIASVTEGEDKPLKYPQMFARADLLVVTKSDLLPHLAFDLDLFLRRASQVRPGVPAIVLSALTGEGMDAWYAFLERARRALAEGDAPGAPTGSPT
jgi:hydrogenase nickel incorporation protein HypB